MNYASRYDVKGVLEDREKGMSYRDMNKKYNISINTLRKIVNDHKEQEKELSVSDIIYSLAVRKEGILESEEAKIISSSIEVWDNDVKKKIRRQCRERAKKEGKECLFIPDWMGRQAARANRDFMFSLATELNERLNEYVMEYCRQTGYNGQDVMFVLCQLAIPKYSPASITEICARYEKIIEQIENV